LAQVDAALSHLSAGHGSAVAIVVATVELIIGVGMLHDRWRNVAALTGAVFGLVIWLTAEGLGGLATGQATDPNSGPLLVLIAAALYVPAAARAGQTVARPRTGPGWRAALRIESTAI
jgi:uncharacterized membrane protein YphA (DoxX/SURF4 family)